MYRSALSSVQVQLQFKDSALFFPPAIPPVDSPQSYIVAAALSARHYSRNSRAAASFVPLRVLLSKLVCRVGDIVNVNLICKGQGNLDWGFKPVDSEKTSNFTLRFKAGRCECWLHRLGLGVFSIQF